MKKSVSFCLLSILFAIFALMPKISQGQTPASCCMWVENLDPAVDTFERTTLEYPVVNTTDLYKIFFDCSSLDPKTKISIEWEIYRDGILLGNNLHEYADVTLMTQYNRIGDHYASLQLPNGKTPIIDVPMGNEYHSYPGAIQIYPGVSFGPYSLDFLFLHFFQATDNRLKIEWRQVGNYQIKLQIVERINGTAYPTFYYNDNGQDLVIGGHQSLRGSVLAEVVIEGLHRVAEYHENCFENIPFQYGNPLLSFTVSDTVYTDVPVAFYNYDCPQRIDSVVDLTLWNFVELEDVVPPTKIEFCQYYPADTLDFPIAQAQPRFGEIRLDWRDANGQWSPAIVQPTNVADTFYYWVRYAIDGQNITCTGDSAEVMVIVHPAPAFAYTNGADTVEYCLNETPVALTAPTIPGTTVEWFVNNAWTTTAPTPTTDTLSLGLTKYLARRVDNTTLCHSVPEDTIYVYVYGYPNVDITANENPICYGYNLELTASGADTYVWNVLDTAGNARRDTILNVVAQNTFTYRVTGTHVHFGHFVNGAGCATEDTLEVVVYPKITVQQDTTACNAQDFVIDPIVDADVTFSWDNGLPNRIDTIFYNAGNAPIYEKWAYTVVNNTTGCIQNDTMIFQVGPVPIAHVAGPDTICADVAYPFTAADSFQYANTVTWTYLWSIDSITTNPASILITVAGDTTVSVDVTNEYSCTATASMPVYVYPSPKSGIISSTSPSDTVCLNEQITMTAIGDYEFVWFNNETTRTITFTPADTGLNTYRLTAIDSVTGCPKDFTHTVYVLPIPNFGFRANGSIYCENDSVELAAWSNSTVGNYLFDWNVNSGTLLHGATVNFLATETGSAVTYYVTATDIFNGCMNYDSIVVTVNPLPVVTYDFDPDKLDSNRNTPLCNGEKLIVTADAGPDMSYRWVKPGAAGETMNTTVDNYGDSPELHHYVIRVTNNNTSCVVYDTIFVTVMPTPKPVIVPSANIICSNDSAMLSVDRPYASYLWSTGETTRTISVNTAGVYNVLVTDAAGCSDTAAVPFVLTVRDIPTITLVNQLPKDTVCAQDSPLFAEVLGAGAGTISYNWSYNNATTPSISVPAVEVINATASPLNMDFYVTVSLAYSDITCQNVNTVTYIVNPQPQPIIVANINNTEGRICAGDSVILRARDRIVYDDPTIETHYQWVEANILDTIYGIRPLQDTTITLASENTYMCRKSTDIRIRIMHKTPVQILTESGRPLNDTICAGSSIRLKADPQSFDTYSWNGSTPSTNPTFVASAAGPYVLVADDFNGCTVTSDTFRLYHYPAHDVNIGNHVDSLCAIGAATYSITATSADMAKYELTWPTTGTLVGNTWTTTLPGAGEYTYNVIVRDTTYNCIDTLKKVVKLFDLPAINLTVDHIGEDTVCNGTEVTFFTDAKGVSYNWSAPLVGTDTAKGIFTTAGDNVITLIVTDLQTGCTNTGIDSIYVYPAVSIATPQSGVVCAQTTLTLDASFVTANDSYTWYANGVAIGTTNPMTHTPTVDTKYEVVATSAVGCTSTDSVMITLAPIPEYTTTPKEMLVCVGVDTAMRITPNETGYTYLWSNGGTDTAIVATITKDTVFTVAITKGSCTLTDTFKIGAQFANVNIDIPDSVCMGSLTTMEILTTNLTVNTVYSWAGTIGSNPYHTTFIAPGRTPIQVIIEDTVTQCTYTLDTAIFVRNVPASAIIPPAPQNACHGQSITLNGPLNGTLPFASYRWFNDSTTQNITFVPNVPNDTATLNYWVIVSDGICSSTVPVVVNMRPTIDVTLNVVNGDTTCHGTNVMVVATPAEAGNYSYTWNGIGGSDTLIIAAVNTTNDPIYNYYELTLNNVNTGCKTIVKDSIVVRVEPNVSIYTAEPVICKGDFSVLDADRYRLYEKWNWNTGDTTRSINVNTTGTYSVIVTDKHGCQASASFTGPTIIDMMLDIAQADTTTCPTATGVDFALTYAAGYTPSVVWNLNGVQVGTGDNFNTGALVNTTNDTVFYTYTAVASATTANLTCDQTVSRTVAVLPAPKPVVVSAINDTVTACLTDGSIVLHGKDGNLPYADASIDTMSTWFIIGGVTGRTPVTFNYTTAGAYNGTFAVRNDYNCRTEVDFTVNVVTGLPLQIISSNGKLVADTVCKGTDLTLTVTSGSNLVWNGSISGDALDLVNIQKDTTVTVASTSGCFAPSSYKVVARNLPVVDITSTPTSATVCQNDSIELVATGASTYVWSNSLGTKDTVYPSTATAGVTTYYVTGTDIYGCTNVDSIKVTVNALPTLVLSTSADSTCAQDIIVSAYATGDAPLGYSWDNGATFGMDTFFTVTAAGVSTVKVIVSCGHGCEVTDSVSVKINALPLADITTTDPVEFCNGDSITVKYAYATADARQTLTFNGAAITFNDTVFNANNYIVDTNRIVLTVVDTITGCDNVDTLMFIVHPVPVIDASAVEDTICFGEDIVLVAKDATLTYAWSNKEGLTPTLSAGTDTATLTVADYMTAVTTDTVLTFYVTGSTAHCDATDSIKVLIRVLPDGITNPTTATTTECQFSTLTVTAALNANYQYDWGTHSAVDTNEIDVFFANAGMDTICLVVTDLLTSCQTFDTLIVTVTPAPDATTIEGGSRCDSVILSYAGTNSVAWTFEDVAGVSVTIPQADLYTNATGDSLIVKRSGTAYMTVTDLLNCTNTDTVKIAFREPILDIVKTGTNISIYDTTFNAYQKVSYDVIVRNECGWGLDTAVSINYTIYRNDVAVGTGYKAMNTYLTGDNAIHYLVNNRTGDGQAYTTAKGYYDVNATGNIPSGEYQGNDNDRRFTLQAFGGGHNVYTWFFMHFLMDRPVTVTFDAIDSVGVYRIEYELVKHEMSANSGTEYFKWNHVYDANPTHFIGGHTDPQGRVLATRTMILNVNPGVAPVPPTPAPIAAATVSAKMKAYPNPVQSVLNLEVKNVDAGTATVTITNINGTALETFKATIDDADVTVIQRYLQANYTDGTYVVVLRKGSMTVTEKIIIKK